MSERDSATHSPRKLSVPELALAALILLGSMLAGTRALLAMADGAGAGQLLPLLLPIVGTIAIRLILKRRPVGHLAAAMFYDLQIVAYASEASGIWSARSGLNYSFPMAMDGSELSIDIVSIVLSTVHIMMFALLKRAPSDDAGKATVADSRADR